MGRRSCSSEKRTAHRNCKRARRRRSGKSLLVVSIRWIFSSILSRLWSIPGTTSTTGSSSGTFDTNTTIAGCHSMVAAKPMYFKVEASLPSAALLRMCSTTRLFLGLSSERLALVILTLSCFVLCLMSIAVLRTKVIGGHQNWQNLTFLHIGLTGFIYSPHKIRLVAGVMSFCTGGTISDDRH